MTALTACGANGVLGLNPKPDGNIVVTNAVTSAVIVSTAASPFMVTSGGFSIGITENYFSGPYTVSVISWSAPFNIPCFVPHYVSSSQKTNVVKFTSDNGAPITDLTQASPCDTFVSNGQKQTDAETAQISDNDGHTINFYYKISH